MIDSNVKDLYNQIISLEKLTPSKKVNSLFSRLVSRVLEAKEGDSLSSSEISKLQVTCGKAEYFLELYWAKKIISSKFPKLTLNRFPYLENYKKLTSLEWNTLIGCGSHESHKVLFIGSGPLPLTAVVLAMFFGQECTVMDKDKDAVKISRKLINCLRLDKKIEVIESSAESYKNYSEFNIVILAALAGALESQKKIIIKQVEKNTKPGTHLLARSSYGTRRLLYKPVKLDYFDVYKPIAEVRPHNEVVNSFFVLTK